MEEHTAYDYRMHDSVWQRVSPGCDPYGENGMSMIEPRREAACPQKKMAAEPPAQEETLPGAQLDPCCMGSEATPTIPVLEGFIEEELAQRRCYLGLAQRLCHGGAARLLRELAQEKKMAVQEMKTAYYLITGSCYETCVSVERMRWNCAADALRSCYHQEACNAFNYRRASEEAVDLCLTKLLEKLSKCAFARADALMALLGQMLG